MAGLDDIRAAQRPADYPIRYSRGDSLEISFQLRDGRNRPVDLTGVSVSAVATQSWGYAVSYSLDAAVVDAVTGLVSVSWPPSTGAVLPTSGVWALILTDGATWTKTVITGTLSESLDGVVQCGCTGEAGSCSPCGC